LSISVEVKEKEKAKKIFKELSITMGSITALQVISYIQELD